MGRFVSLRLNWHPHNLALEKQPRPSREQSAGQRNLHLLKERTGRIKTVCLSWLGSCRGRSRLTSNRLKRLRRLLLLTWPSSARLNRSWRRQRREPSWPWLCKLRKSLNYPHSIEVFNPNKITKNL